MGSRPALGNVAILAFCQAMMMSGASLLISSSALVGRQIAENPSLATVPLGLQFLATMLTALPASLLMARIGRRAGFSLGAAMGLLGALLCVTAVLWGNFWLFCAGALCVGVFNGFGQLFRFAAVEAVPASWNSRAVSWVLAGGVLAAFIGPNLARLGQHWLDQPFAGSFAGLIVLYVLALLALSRLRMPRPVVPENPEPERPMSEVFRQPLMLLAVFSAVVAYGLMNLVMTATPLAMADRGMPFGEAAHVIQWHILGMFLPSFFTGNLIGRLGVRPVMTLGALLIGACLLVNISGQLGGHFFWALLLLGVGWNFLFIGATSLLTTTYRPSEKARVQGINDLLVFGTVACSAILSSSLLEGLGWVALNLAGLPVVGLVLLGLVWSAMHARAGLRAQGGEA
ncbi:MFS transporter [Alkalilimnicola sp. S0819]|uniref:MFS transporter n=1 Tax=Alkalilimnicola sp. S0819 TaxID=2613922 RepID=UPI001261562A|nr:MFS transporter [Alkalilimnicola sp. S0819]KAB7619570.1 MFS transporter [Alkalilimnicola sp. S0819]MPQ17622.1 MFS transporter [Alkalilimnicola sp. S0819]